MTFGIFCVESLVIETDNSHSVQLPPRLDSRLGWKKEGGESSNQKSWTDLWREIAQHRPPVDFLPNLRSIRLNNAVVDHLFPIIGISGENLERIEINNLHGKIIDSHVKRFLNALKAVPKLEDVFVRNGGFLIPDRIIAQAPLRRLRMDPRRSDTQVLLHKLFLDYHN